MAKKNDSQSDRVLVLTTFALVIFGLVMVASAGIIYSQTRFDDQYYFFWHQLAYGVLPGAAAFYFLRRMDYRLLKGFTVPLFLLSIILLVLVFIPSVGLKTYGASRWIQLGPLSFQPSELAKLAIILYMALWLEKKGQKGSQDFLDGFLPFLVIIGIVGFLIIKQPDMGTLGVIVLTTLAIYFAAGAKLSHISLFLLSGLVAFFVLIKVEPYRFQRFLSFLDPTADPQGSGYHISQALFAIGSGGWLGIGLGHSRQKFNYLPEPVGDSIFAIIGEELGIVGAVCLIVLFILFAIRGYRIAQNAPDKFGRLAAVGITSWVVFQAFINIGAITATIPLTGVPLPFVSYGGTSLVFLLSGAGILSSISQHSKVTN